ncbi:MAG: hypothetical protein Tsb0020_33740 [Haliangiales bacterium]
MRVAIMDFTNAAGGDMAHLGKGLQSMLITDLAEVEKFELIERARLNDIRAELTLAQSELIDKRSAVRIGKLAGASHLIAGSYTVVGARMRIDARLFTVASGKILLAAEVEGERDAFFELEKELVRKLVRATGVDLAPKERAGISKIHTADFAAFEKFSQGLNHFDAERYEQAMKALRQASELDGDFELARITLVEYERLARETRARADAAAVAETELARLKQDQTRQREAQVVAALFSQVSKLDRPGDRVRRQVVLNMLLQIYENNFHGFAFRRWSEETGDKFAFVRTLDRVQQSYWAGALELLGTMPPFGGYIGVPPTEVSAIADGLRDAEARLRKRPDAFLDFKLDSNVHRLARRLHLDQREQADLFASLVRYGLKHSKDERLRRRWMLELAERYQDAFALDESTRTLRRLSAMTEDAKTLEEAATMLEENRDLATLTRKGGPLQRFIRENLANVNSRPMRHPIAKVRELFVGGSLSRKAASELERARRWHDRDYLLLGDRPMWLLQGGYEIRIGPRRDRYRADGLRYYIPSDARDDKTFGLLGAWGEAPVGDLSLGATISYRAPQDFILARSSEDDRVELTTGAAGKARVGILFGLENIDTDGDYDRSIKRYRVDRPLRGYCLYLAEDELVLARVEEERFLVSSKAKRRLTSKVIARQAVKLGAADSAAVKLSVRGGKVRAEALGETLTATLRGYQPGFLGLAIDGRGYAEFTPDASAGKVPRGREKSRKRRGSKRR